MGVVIVSLGRNRHAITIRQPGNRSQQRIGKILGLWAISAIATVPFGARFLTPPFSAPPPPPPPVPGGFFRPAKRPPSCLGARGRDRWRGGITRSEPSPPQMLNRLGSASLLQWPVLILRVA